MNKTFLVNALTVQGAGPLTIAKTDSNKLTATTTTINADTTVNAGAATLGAVTVAPGKKLTVGNKRAFTSLAGTGGTLALDATDDSISYSASEVELESLRTYNGKVIFKGTNANKETGKVATGVELPYTIGKGTMSAKFAFEGGTHTFQYGVDKTQVLFGPQGTDDDPTLEVKNGATLNFCTKDLSGWNPQSNAEKVILRVGERGTLNFTQYSNQKGEDQTAYFNNRLVLDNEAIVKIQNTDDKFRMNGGVRREATAQLAMLGGETETSATVTGEKITLADDGSPGVGVSVGANATLTIENNIAGASGRTFAKYGAGTLVLSGAFESSPITVNGGVLDFSVAEGTRTVDVGISGSGTVTKSGAGTLLLRGAVSTPVTISGGRVLVTGNGTLGSGAVTVNEGKTLEVQVADSATKTLSNTISGTGTLVKSGAGTLSLTGTVSTPVEVAAGTLDLGTNRPTIGGITDGATLKLTASVAELVNKTITLSTTMTTEPAKERFTVIGPDGTTELTLTEEPTVTDGTLTVKLPQTGGSITEITGTGNWSEAGVPENGVVCVRGGESAASAITVTLDEPLSDYTHIGVIGHVKFVTTTTQATLPTMIVLDRGSVLTANASFEGAYTIPSGATVVLDGTTTAISSGSALTVNGALTTKGTVTLTSADCAFSGLLTVESGTLTWRHDDYKTITGDITVNTGATFATVSNYKYHTTLTGALSGAGTIRAKVAMILNQDDDTRYIYCNGNCEKFTGTLMEEVSTTKESHSAPRRTNVVLKPADGKFGGSLAVQLVTVSSENDETLSTDAAANAVVADGVLNYAKAYITGDAEISGTVDKNLTLMIGTTEGGSASASATTLAGTLGTVTVEGEAAKSTFSAPITVASGSSLSITSATPTKLTTMVTGAGTLVIGDGSAATAVTLAAVGNSTNVTVSPKATLEVATGAPGTIGDNTPKSFTNGTVITNNGTLKLTSGYAYLKVGGLGETVIPGSDFVFGVVDNNPRDTFANALTVNEGATFKVRAWGEDTFAITTLTLNGEMTQEGGNTTVKATVSGPATLKTLGENVNLTLNGTLTESSNAFAIGNGSCLTLNLSEKTTIANWFSGSGNLVIGDGAKAVTVALTGLNGGYNGTITINSGATLTNEGSMASVPFGKGTGKIVNNGTVKLMGTADNEGGQLPPTSGSGKIVFCAGSTSRIPGEITTTGTVTFEAASGNKAAAKVTFVTSGDFSGKVASIEGASVVVGAGVTLAKDETSTPRITLSAGETLSGTGTINVPVTLNGTLAAGAEITFGKAISVGEGATLSGKATFAAGSVLSSAATFTGDVSFEAGATIDASSATIAFNAKVTLPETGVVKVKPNGSYATIIMANLGGLRASAFVFDESVAETYAGYCLGTPLYNPSSEAKTQFLMLLKKPTVAAGTSDEVVSAIARAVVDDYGFSNWQLTSAEAIGNATLDGAALFGHVTALDEQDSKVAKVSYDFGVDWLTVTADDKVVIRAKVASSAVSGVSATILSSTTVKVQQLTGTNAEGNPVWADVTSAELTSTEIEALGQTSDGATRYLSIERPSGLATFSYRVVATDAASN